MLKQLGFSLLKSHRCLEYSRMGALSAPSTSFLMRNYCCGKKDSSGVMLYPGTDITFEEAWKRRIRLRQPKLQRDEQVSILNSYFQNSLGEKMPLNLTFIKVGPEFALVVLFK